MPEPEGYYSRTVQAGVLGRTYPNVKKQLNSGELLLAVSGRKTPYFTGAFCIFIGAIMVWQSVTYLMSLSPLIAIPVLLLCLALVWAGVRLVVFVRREYVFLTDSRIAYQKVDLFCRIDREPLSIPLPDIGAAHLQRRSAVVLPKKTTAGDIIIKKNGRTYLFPTIKDGVDFSEVLMAELKRIDR